MAGPIKFTVKPRKYHNTVLAAIIVSGLALRLTSPVNGAELIEFHPHLSLTGYYDDNVDFSPQSSLSDSYLVLSPGLDVRLNLKQMPIKADYTYTRYQYRTRTELNRDFHNFSINTEKALSVFKNITLELRDKYDAVPVAVTQPGDQPNNLTQRNLVAVMPVWEKHYSQKMLLKAGYEFSRVDYTSGGLRGDDYFGHRFFARWEGKIDRALTIYQNNQYQMKYYRSAPDYTQFLPEAGVRLHFGKRWSIDARGGYSFDEVGREKEQGYVYSVVGSWLPTAKVKLDGTFERRRSTDVRGETYTEEYYGLVLRYHPAKRLALESRFRYYDYTFTNAAESKRISFKVGADYRLNRWASLRAGYIREQNVDMPADESAEANRVYLGVHIKL